MDRLIITQRIKIIKTYYKNRDSATATYSGLRGNCGLHNRPTVHFRFARSAENIVSESVAETRLCRFLVVLRN